MSYYLISWFLLLLIFFLNSRNLLLMLILLELLSFTLLFFFSYYTFSLTLADYYVIILFSVFVIEGVIALSGLICLVSFRGRDYLLASSVCK